MGRYMRKARSDEVAVMEVGSIQQQSTNGVRTRARTLALQRLQSTGGDSSSYLELRSRRLEKPMSLLKPMEVFKEGPNPSPRSKSSKAAASPRSEPWAEEVVEEIEVSFGENVLDFDAARNARETTPCNLIRDSEAIGTPGSTTRCSNSSSTSRRVQTHRSVPTSHEMEEFFACAERLQQRIFTDKYNFDPVNECPLPGRYEWVKVE